MSITTHTLDDPDHGLSEEVLEEADVLTWWVHTAHREFSDEVVERVQRHALSGLGLIVLHPGPWLKMFIKLLGTTCTPRWREDAFAAYGSPTTPVASVRS